MNAEPRDIAAVESLLAFWADAGVDACFEEAAVDRTIVVAPALKAVTRATASVTPVVDMVDATSDARHLAHGADTMEALAEAAASFKGCELVGMGARGCVFGRGDPHAPILIIGEAPGAEEDAAGEPFVGKAGKLLDKMIAAAGLTGKVYTTNTVFWRPPGNRTPTPQEQAVCAPFVERAFFLMKPKAVLLLGAAAARGVLKTDEGIMRMRGQWREWRLAEGDVSAPVMPTLHPAFLLHQPQAKRQVWADILELAVKLDGQENA
ncbi:MAG: uracil-DNA glycosylase [Brevundimonas subvibrioides]|uniref:Type-4 uracil-DNA glycosylase n=1 Tax=Brevundimonas subvibrioides TaxID=74313 RepID=A0A258HM52_9CAUL|nr:uracil-DNA glycosylase [Brevundimonas subvibrioides]OYX57442.1 MAG: uracil-DNA glycosylase [Brevundimonas subvibrioides]